LRRFEAEHEEALAALERLERAAEALRGRTPPEAPLAVAGEVHRFLAGAVREHNEAEERALFPLLGSETPLEPFREEHQVLWGLEERLGRAVGRADGPEVAELSVEIVQLLRSHIQREEARCNML
jgi:hemerythrin-like domain-containing protein